MDTVTLKISEETKEKIINFYKDYQIEHDENYVIFFFFF